MNRETCANSFEKLLFSVSEEITNDKLGELKFLCKGVIPKGTLAEIKKPFELFDTLIDNGKLSKQNTTFLEELLTKIGEDTQSKRVKKYGNGHNDHLNQNAVVQEYKHGLPHKKDLFVGRDAFVLEIADLFTVKNKRMAVILGPPGYGKSTVVIHIGHALYDRQVSVIFVSLRQTTTMHQLCTDILKAIDPEYSLSDNVIVQAQNRLASCKYPTVLILDNCEDIQNSQSGKDFQTFIEYIGNQANNVQLLLGTRKPIATISFESHTEHLRCLDISPSASLLQKFAHEKITNNEAKILGKRCGGVPLLIKLAGARVNNGYKPAKLAEDLKSRPYDVLKFKCDQIQDRLIESIRVFLDSLDRDMLYSLIRLSNYPNVFTQEDVCELYIRDPIDCSNMLCRLRGNALLHLEGEHYSLHPLLQTFCREEQTRMRCTEEGKKATQAFTLHYLNKLESLHRQFVSTKFQDALHQFEHDRMNINQAMENGIKSESKKVKQRCIDAFNNSVNFLGKIMQPSQCLEIYQHLYDVASELNDTRRIAECLNSIGFRHFCNADHQKFSQDAFDSFESAYKLFKGLKKKERKIEAFAHCQSKLGLCYMYMTKMERQKGKKLMQDAVSLRQELGDQVLLAASYCDKAIAARLSDEHSQAITILKEECYPKYTANLGDHPWVGTLLNYISESYKALGKFDDAIEYNKKSLAIRQKTLGDHQDTARSFVHLAELLEETHNSNEAVENYRKALSIQEKVLGDHEETEVSYQAIANILALGELKSEEEVVMRKRADSCRDTLNKRTQVQTQISVEIKERANSHLQIENRKCLTLKISLAVVLAAIVVAIFIKYNFT